MNVKLWVKRLAWSSVYLSTTLFKGSFLQADEAFSKQPEIPLPIFKELAFFSHPVTTQSEKAQRYFDQGLAFFYSFNHDAARECFEEAAQLDPTMAMAYWGQALAQTAIFSPELSKEQNQKGYEAIQKAFTLAGKVTPCEQAYIQALSKRFSDQTQPDFKQLTSHYKEAMYEIVKAYPDDPDAATLFASGALDLSVDNLWKSNGGPTDEGRPIVDILETTLKSYPDHIGANHFYIHTLESSKFPERALTSANRLVEIAPPILNHLVHTPCHIYILVGDYHASIACNQQAVAASQQFIQRFGPEKDALDNLFHNTMFLTRSYAMAGHYEGAKKAAEELKAIYTPYFDKEKGMEFYYSFPIFVMTRFQKWSELLKQPEPPTEMKLSRVFWYFGRALAFNALQGHEQQAIEEKQRFYQAQEPDLKKKKEKTIAFLNLYLEAQWADKHQDSQKAIDLFQKATAIQDEAEGELPFNWLIFVRENLGGALLRDQQVQVAEQVFRKELEIHPRNGVALFGLLKSLQAQAKTAEAFWIESQFKKAWKDSDTHLTIKNL